MPLAVSTPKSWRARQHIHAAARCSTLPASVTPSLPTPHPFTCPHRIRPPAHTASVHLPTPHSSTCLLFCQIAKAQGAHVTTTCSARNVDFVKLLGADVAVDYSKNEKFEDHGPFDIVVDPIGGT